MREGNTEEVDRGDINGGTEMLNAVENEIAYRDKNLFVVLVGCMFCIIVNFFFGIYAIIQGSQTAQITFVFIANIILILTVLLVYLYD